MPIVLTASVNSILCILFLDDVINNSGSLLINRGSTAAVLISLDEYTSIKETAKVLSSEGLSSNPESRNLIQGRLLPLMLMNYDIGVPARRTGYV